MASIIQRNYAIYPKRGFVGDIAENAHATVTDVGRLHVPTSGRKPRPGDALFYNKAESAFALPTAAAESARVCAILGYRQDHVATMGTGIVEYEDDDMVQVTRVGSVWVEAGAAVQYNDLMTQTIADWQWDPLAVPAAFANLVEFPIYCGDIEGASSAGDIIKARIGYGRIK